MKLKTILKNKIYISLFLVIVLIGAAAIYFKHSMDYPFKVKNDVSFYVKNGDNLNSVTNRLASNNIIKSKVFLKAYIKYNKVPGDIKPGLYSIKKGESMKKFLQDIAQGNFSNDYVKVTIPEGYDVDEIASLFDKKGLIKKDDFINACKNYNIPSYIKNDNARKYKVEGYLFPDTYEFKKGTKGEDLINTMIKRFNEVIKEAEKNTNKSASDIDQTIIMASIIEREAEIDKDRPVIASVFFNRLKIKMKLQSCATVEYALGHHKNKLSNEDLKIKSNYNTYLVDGMPEGPICSPGKASIEAALNPANTNYIYFVSNNDRTHSFTNNYQEFLKIKKKTQGF
ncbi:endolytic transglycosylase MltG [Clostridium felsineum]|uniref:Endolytic murein transglycosylase n=1 Tax=Clostridium felsineum TaxID=36839 RepID=A0A1S8L024_9CLOT|nr:endolytic transglycosylase MltG [Clostridium felsineum]URZ00850.1 Endolytic murein transglycosylase [Clostridium felsineum]URZ06403.1 Endolytic murein transglycosylase [Clostridium felsineum]URZ11438.1 Endolytic murein transglycosylase [Clostridium felsineum]